MTVCDFFKQFHTGAFPKREKDTVFLQQVIHSDNGSGRCLHSGKRKNTTPCLEREREEMGDGRRILHSDAWKEEKVLKKGK